MGGTATSFRAGQCEEKGVKVLTVDISRVFLGFRRGLVGPENACQGRRRGSSINFPNESKVRFRFKPFNSNGI